MRLNDSPRSGPMLFFMKRIKSAILLVAATAMFSSTVMSCTLSDGGCTGSTKTLIDAASEMASFLEGKRALMNSRTLDVARVPNPNEKPNKGIVLMGDGIQGEFLTELSPSSSFYKVDHECGGPPNVEAELLMKFRSQSNQSSVPISGRFSSSVEPSSHDAMFEGKIDPKDLGYTYKVLDPESYRNIEFFLAVIYHRDGTISGSVYANLDGVIPPGDGDTLVAYSSVKLLTFSGAAKAPPTQR